MKISTQVAEEPLSVVDTDDIFLLKQRLAEQEALIHALQEKLSNREREIDHLQAQLDKLRRMNFGSRSEKVSRRIAQMEADLNRLHKESDTLTGRVYDPAVQRPLRQTRTRKPFPESLPRDEKRLLPAAPCCPNCGGSLSYLGEDTTEQLELMRSAFRVIRTVREKHACTQCDAIVQAPAPSRPIERGIARPGLLARVLTSKYAEHTPLYRQSEIYGRQGVDPVSYPHMTLPPTPYVASLGHHLHPLLSTHLTHQTPPTTQTQSLHT
ncbi:IS66 family transposase zinc-finger binding domain-containing protein, partial [Escherichia coli]|uniref:IS66 family transposase n=1 Tax=Escherichia coli TaxID=562 RepID=UPI000ACB3914